MSPETVTIPVPATSKSVLPQTGYQQSADELVYSDPSHPKRYFFSSTTDDEHFLLYIWSEGTSGTGILWRDLTSNDKKLRTLFEGLIGEYSVLDNEGDQLVGTHQLYGPQLQSGQSRSGKILHRKTGPVIPEKEDLLEWVNASAGKLCRIPGKMWLPGAVQFDRTGKQEREVNCRVWEPPVDSAAKRPTATYFTISPLSLPRLISIPMT